jgi:hypothetical protein
VEARVRSLVGKLGMTPTNVKRIQVAAVLAVALYGVELARAITGGLPSTALCPAIKES